jgi:hypothetical protein
MRCDREDEGHLAELAHLDAGRRGHVGADAHADREIGLAAGQRFPCAGKHLGAQAAAACRGPCCRSAAVARCRLVQRVERLAQLEHREAAR